MTLALLCSGQGNQHSGMFDLTADAPEAAEVFAAATRSLGGRDPRQLVRNETTDIHANAIGQVLCCTQALAAIAALKSKLDLRLIIAGYSVGEVASWGCAGLTDPALTLDLATKRATAMDAASQAGDGLAYVRGLDRARLGSLCARHDVAIAIANPADMFVIGGARDALTAACDDAMASGATHSGALKVFVASHTARLSAASDAFRRDLAVVTASRVDPRIRLLSGVDATTVRSVPNGLDKLAQQISHTIEWAGCLGACAEAGMTAALELGPGNALATMVAAAHPGINARSLDDFRSLAGVERWLAEVQR